MAPRPQFVSLLRAWGKYGAGFSVFLVGAALPRDEGEGTGPEGAEGPFSSLSPLFPSRPTVGAQSWAALWTINEEGRLKSPGGPNFPVDLQESPWDQVTTRGAFSILRSGL